MKYTQEDLQELLLFLKEKTGFVQDRGNEIICRCIFCGDSIKNKNKGHCYINKEMGVFHCVRCDAAGPVNYLLSILEYNGPTIFSSVSKRKRQAPNILLQQRKLVLPDVNPNHYYKLDYLISRNVNIEKDLEYRIVWSLYDFATRNNISLSDYNYKLLDDLDTNYVGFLTYFGSKIIFRAVNTDAFLRYFILPLTYDNIDYYMLNRLNYKTIPTIIVCEGVFDVIVGEQKLQKWLDIDNYVIIASSGKGFSNAITWTQYALGITYYDLILVYDRDAKYKLRKYQFARSTKIILPIDAKDIAECNEYSLLTPPMRYV